MEDFTASNDMLALGCDYRSDDFYEADSGALRFQLCCHLYDADEAETRMIGITRDEGAAYPVGDDGYVVDASFTDTGSGRPVLGERAYVRSGSQICDAPYHVMDPGAAEAAPEVKAALEYVMTTTAAGV